MSEEKSKSFERKQEVIDAAFKEFSENGYDQASLNNILKEAGISKGTFYYHFKNKEDLYFYIIELLFEEKKKFFMSRITPEDYNQNIFEIFKLQGKLGMELARENPIINSFGKSFLNERGNEIYKKVMNKYKIDEDAYYDYIVETSFARGEFRADIPKEFIKRIIGYLFRNITEIGNIAKIEDYENSIDFLIEFMKSGLGKKE